MNLLLGGPRLPFLCGEVAREGGLCLELTSFPGDLVSLQKCPVSFVPIPKRRRAPLERPSSDQLSGANQPWLFLFEFLKLRETGSLFGGRAPGWGESHELAELEVGGQE